jgi:hypothetical protein
MDALGYLGAAKQLAATQDIDKWTVLKRVCLPRLSEVDWPPQVRHELQLAERHCAGEPQDLACANSASCDYLRTTYSSGDAISIREGRAAKGLLVVLWPEAGKDKMFTHAEWFPAIVDNEKEWA